MNKNSKIIFFLILILFPSPFYKKCENDNGLLFVTISFSLLFLKNSSYRNNRHLEIQFRFKMKRISSELSVIFSSRPTFDRKKISEVEGGGGVGSPKCRLLQLILAKNFLHAGKTSHRTRIFHSNDKWRFQWIRLSCVCVLYAGCTPFIIFQRHIHDCEKYFYDVIILKGKQKRSDDIKNEQKSWHLKS